MTVDSRRVGAALALCLLLTALAAPAAGRSRKAKTIPWGLSGCRAVIALIPVDPEAIEEHLPAGFSAVVPDSVRAVLPPDPRLQAVLGLEALGCEAGVGVKSTLTDVDYGSIWTFVEPPAELADPDHPLSFFKWETLVTDPASRRLLSSRGVPVTNGEADFASWNETPLGIGLDVSLRLGEDTTHRFVGAAGAPTEFTGAFIEFSPARGSLSEWRTIYDAEVAYGGGGLVEMEPGSFPAEVAGENDAQAYFLVTTGLDFTEASITIP